MLTKASLTLVAHLASASIASAAQTNRFDLDLPNSKFPTSSDDGQFDPSKS